MKPRLTWASPHRKGLLGQLHLQLWHLPSFPFLRFPFWILFLQISKICPQCFHNRQNCRNKISRQASHCSNEWKCFPESQKIFGTRLDDDTAGWSIDFPPLHMVCQKVILNICEPHDGSELLTKIWSYICCTRMLMFSRGEDARWWVKRALIGWGAPEGFADPEMIQVIQDAMRLRRSNHLWQVDNVSWLRHVVGNVLRSLNSSQLDQTLSRLLRDFISKSWFY